MVDVVEVLSIGPHGELEVEEADGSHSGCFSFVAAGVSELAPAISLNVSPGGGSGSWCGEFFGGHEDVSSVVLGVSLSTGDGVLVVARGVGYLVPVGAPEVFEVVSLRPIRDVVVCASDGVALLVGYTDVVAVGAGGELWDSGRLVWDGFTSVRVGSGSVVVTGFDAPSGRDVEITLDLATGDVLSRF